MKRLFLLLALSSNISLADNFVTFNATGSPGFLTIVGKGGVITGKPIVKDGKASGKFDFVLGSMDTGLDTRNQHMKEKYLEVSKYPTASLELDPVVMPKTGYFNWTGKLTLHGETKAVEGVCFVDGKQIEAKFSIKTSDFKIQKATYLGVGIDDKIAIIVRLEQ